MARFNYSGVAITGGTGRLNSGFGGSVLLKNGVVRNYVTPTNPQSANQIAIRASFAAYQAAWANLSEAQRLTWQAGLSDPQWYISDAFTGTSRPATSGKALFTLVNINKLVANDASGGGTVYFSTLPAVSAIDPIDNANIAAAAAAGTFNITWGGGTTVNDVIVCYASPPVSPGIQSLNSVKSKLRFITAVPSGESTPYTAASAYTALFGAITAAAGLKIGFRIDGITEADGRRRILATGLSVIAA